jgi:ubiquinone/menaquinone biosynthesis C-methylase UbiE/uncharacterized protein YbaR (Trm112 family)
MRYALLEFVVCPRCHHDLTTITLREAALPAADTGQAKSGRVPQAGALVGPIGSAPAGSAVGDILRALATPAAPPTRGLEVVLEDGLLVCATCGAWFPVTRCVPELLSDHLRDWDRDRLWLDARAGSLPAALTEALRAFAPASATDPGAHHKLAEITLPSKITDKKFWGPGYVSPFNLWTPEHTWHLIRNFAVTEPLLELGRNRVVLDSGAGYGWTTEWLLRGGYEPIGIDICREYLEIAIARAGSNRPHLVVGDAEHLPIRDRSVHAVLAFEAFHHIPDRRAAMREFGRVLDDGCPVVLVEPGAAHEHAATSVEVMQKYGTLEKGMELADVAEYAAGSALGECREHHLVRSSVAPDESADLADRPAENLLANHVFTLRKGAPRESAAPPPPMAADPGDRTVRSVAGQPASGWRGRLSANRDRLARLARRLPPPVQQVARQLETRTMLQVVLNPVPDPLDVSYAALFGWLRAPTAPAVVEFTAFDRPLHHELHPRSDLADLYPDSYTTGLYAIADVAALADEIRRADHTLRYALRVDGTTYVEGSVRVSPRAMEAAASGAGMKRRKRDFLRSRLACTGCGAALPAPADAPVLTCASCGAVFAQGTEAFNLVAGDTAIPRIVNTSVFSYSDDERRIIAEVEARGGYVLDFGAGLRGTIEPHVVNLEIADYPTTDVVSTSDRLPFADRTFGGVIALHVLEHIRHPWIAAREIVRVLEPGGVAICTVPFVCAEHGFPDHYFNMTRAGLASLFDDLVLEQQFVKPDGVPINAVQQVLSTYWGNLEEPYRAELGAMTVDQLVKTPLAHLVQAGYATQLPAHARWKVAAHTSIVMRKPA